MAFNYLLLLLSVLLVVAARGWVPTRAKIHHGKSKELLNHEQSQSTHYRKNHRNRRWLDFDTADFLSGDRTDDAWKKLQIPSDSFYNWEDNSIWESKADTHVKSRIKKSELIHKLKTTTKPRTTTTEKIPTTTMVVSSTAAPDLGIEEESDTKENPLKFKELEDFDLFQPDKKKSQSYDEEEGLGDDNHAFFDKDIENTGQIFVKDDKKSDFSADKMEGQFKTKVTAAVEPQRAAPKPANLIHPPFTTKKDTVTHDTVKKSVSQKRVTPAIPAPASADTAKKHHVDHCEDDLDCRSGRVCKNSTCECAAEDYCLGLNKPVCGSDGILYPSHCELHRVACTIEKHIKVDTKGVCLQKISTDNKPVVPKLGAIMKDVKKASTTTAAPVKQTPHAEPMKHYDIEVRASDEMLKVKINRDFCNKLEYLQFKEKLLHFHCERFQEPDCNQDTKEFKQYLATLMFSYYDNDLDNFLEEVELWRIEQKENFEKLSEKCTLLNMINYEDSGDKDGKISFKEFVSAFNVPGLLLEQKLRVIPTLATVDNGLEIKCGIKGSSEIIWRRNGVDLHKIHNPEITVFDDGSLYISSVGIHHMGNYTCHDKEDPSIKQTHILKVHMPPKVSVSPTTQLHKSNSDVILKCHAEGIPRPELSWEVNEMPLPNNLRHYIRQHENGTLVIHSANYLTDTGAYKCMAQNQAGKAQDVSTVFIQNPNTSQSMVTTNRFHESFLVFHEDGYIVYEPNECAIRREVKQDYGNFKYIPEALDGPLSLCEPTHPCSWGSTVNVRDKFIYISQPRENRVVVVEITRRWNPVQVINTDKDPVSLHYIENLDQVWVLCWNSEEDTGSKTILVIRDASKDQQHHAVHTQPIGNRFDLVKKMFLPPTNTLHPTFRYGYVMHTGQRGLFKLDIEGMKYMKNIDLNQYKCEPEHIAFIPLGGHIVIQCLANEDNGMQPLQLILDYITDTVISNSTIDGIPYVSPDSQHMVNVNKQDGLLTVTKITEDGKFGYSFTVTTDSVIDDISFFHSSRKSGYDTYLTSAKRNDVIYVNLETGKMEVIKNVGHSSDKKSWPWLESQWSIVSGNVFSEYLLTSTKNSVVIINGHMRDVQCEFKDLKKSDVAVFAEPYKA